MAYFVPPFDATWQTQLFGFWYPYLLFGKQRTQEIGALSTSVFGTEIIGVHVYSYQLDLLTICFCVY